MSVGADIRIRMSNTGLTTVSLSTHVGTVTVKETATIYVTRQRDIAHVDVRSQLIPSHSTSSSGLIQTCDACAAIELYSRLARAKNSIKSA